MTVSGNVDWLLRLASAMVAAGVIALVGLFFAAGGSLTDIDSYEVLHVVPETSKRRHVVVYRHHHANSSAALDGAWIVEGSAPPTVGSRLKPEGRPVALWRGFRPAVHWKDGRVVIAGDVDPAKVLAGRNVGTDCHFRDALDTGRELQLCLDETRVTFLRIKL